MDSAKSECDWVVSPNRFERWIYSSVDMGATLSEARDMRQEIRDNMWTIWLRLGDVYETMRV